MLKILVVEDEGLVAADLESFLQSLGNITWAVNSGEQALELAEVHSFDLAILDIRLAGTLDGVETAQLLWKRFQTGIVFLTAQSNRAILARAQQVHPFGYLAKPFREQDLRVCTEMFAQYLRSRSTRPEGQEAVMSKLLDDMTARTTILN